MNNTFKQIINYINTIDEKTEVNPIELSKEFNLNKDEVINEFIRLELDGLVEPIFKFRCSCGHMENVNIRLLTNEFICEKCSNKSKIDINENGDISKVYVFFKKTTKSL